MRLKLYDTDDDDEEEDAMQHLSLHVQSIARP